MKKQVLDHVKPSFHTKQRSCVWGRMCIVDGWAYSLSSFLHSQFVMIVLLNRNSDLGPRTLRCEDTSKSL